MDKLPRKDKYKILVFKSHGIVAPYLITHLGEGFMNLGHEVLVYDILKKIVSVPLEEAAENILKLIDSLGKSRPDFALMYGVSAIIPLKGPPDNLLFRFPEGAHEELRGDTHILALHRIPCLEYFGDDPANFNNVVQHMKIAPYHWMAIWDEFYMEEFRTRGYDNLIQAPLATSTTFFYDVPLEQVPPGFRCDVSFLGSSTPERVALFKEISGFADIAIFGRDDWKKYDEVAHLYRGTASYPDEANLLYNGSRITIEVKKEQVKTTFTQRQFDASAGGNFVLSDHRPGLEKYFEPGKEFVSYTDNEDLVRKIKYYLEHDDERKEIAAAAQKRTLAEHTWTHRAKTILEHITEV